MVLVCGGAGYIGSHMVKRLRQEGIEHLVLDDLSKGHREAVAGSPFVQVDLRDPAEVAGVFASHPITSVMHFASSTEVGESVQKPALYYQNNVVATGHLLEAMRAAKVERFVFSSTAAVYGEPKTIPIPEDHPKDPTNPYGDTKLAVERMLAAYDTAYGLKSVALRYFNAAGADPEGELGEDHQPESHLIPRAALAALGRASISIFGTDYPTPDGTAVRDYVHVNDLAEAHLMALRHLEAGGESRRYNLGNGKGFSVREVVDTVCKVHGQDFEVGESGRRAGDPAFLVADSTAITKDWGWQPSYTELESMVRTAYDWLKSHPNGYRTAQPI